MKPDHTPLRPNAAFFRLGLLALVWVGAGVALSPAGAAGLQIGRDPMQPVEAPAMAASAPGGTDHPHATAPQGLQAAPPDAGPALKATRLGAGGWRALIDDRWVQEGDRLADHRVLSVSAVAVHLQTLRKPVRSLHLRLNPWAGPGADSPETPPASLPAAGSRPQRGHRP